MSNTWGQRLAMLIVLLGTLALHAYCLAGKPNTSLGMLGFHISAALVDLLLIRCAPILLSGKLLDDMQILCWLSIVVNLAGWLFYMAYAPPFFYNTAQWILSVIQWGRLFIPDDKNAANSMGAHSVCRPLASWPQLDTGKKTK